MAVLYVRKECHLPHGQGAREEKRKEEEEEKANLCDPTMEEMESEGRRLIPALDIWGVLGSSGL